MSCASDVDGRLPFDKDKVRENVLLFVVWIRLIE